MIAVRSVLVAGIDFVLELTPIKYEDGRGYFSDVFNKAQLARLGLSVDFVQDNQSLSRSVGTVRGLHFQFAPYTQAKLVRVLRGAILDVAVDIRAGSPTFGQHVSIEISAAKWNQVFVPKGFAHGFCTLEPDTEVLYKVDAPYSLEHEGGLLWCDPDLRIAWPVDASSAVVSDKDKELPRLSNLTPDFVYSEVRNDQV